MKTVETTGGHHFSLSLARSSLVSFLPCFRKEPPACASGFKHGRSNVNISDIFSETGAGENY